MPRVCKASFSLLFFLPVSSPSWSVRHFHSLASLVFLRLFSFLHLLVYRGARSLSFFSPFLLSFAYVLTVVGIGGIGCTASGLTSLIRSFMWFCFVLFFYFLICGFLLWLRFFLGALISSPCYVFNLRRKCDSLCL